MAFEVTTRKIVITTFLLGLFSSSGGFLRLQELSQFSTLRCVRFCLNLDIYRFVFSPGLVLNL